jgi:hypothetical protein
VSKALKRGKKKIQTKPPAYFGEERTASAKVLRQVHVWGTA